MALYQMTAELIIDDPNTLAEVTAVFIELGFEVEFLDDWIDDDGKYIWLLVDFLTTNDDQDDFFDWVSGLVAPFGDVVEAGLCSPERRIAWRNKRACPLVLQRLLAEAHPGTFWAVGGTKRDQNSLALTHGQYGFASSRD